MDDKKRQLHLRLAAEAYRKLKVRCAYEGTSMQDCVARVIDGLVQYPRKQSPENRDKTCKLSILELFHECPVLADVDRYELERLADASVIRCFNKGEIIDREGEISNSFYIIKDGIVKVFKASPSGKEFIIDMRYKGEIFGEAAVIKGIPHFASTQALQNTEVVAIGRRDLLDSMARNPFIASRIADVEFDKIHNLYDRIIDLVADNARQRLSKILYVFSCKYGNTLQFTHKDIAEMSGTTAETVTRVMTQLKNSGILSSTRGSVTIIDRERLLSSDI